MGEPAEDTLDGKVCEGCGGFFDDIIDGEDPPGFPRRCPSCEPPRRRRKRRRAKPSTTRGHQPH